MTHVDSAAVGLAGVWRWRHDYSIDMLTGYTEMDIGRWRTCNRINDKGFTQLGITPVLRLHPAGIHPGWVAEAGMGVN